MSLSFFAVFNSHQLPLSGRVFDCSASHCHVGSFCVAPDDLSLHTNVPQRNDRESLPYHNFLNLEQGLGT